MPVHAVRADAFAGCFVMLIVRNDLRDLCRLTTVSCQPKSNGAKPLIALSNRMRQRVQRVPEHQRCPRGYHAGHSKCDTSDARDERQRSRSGASSSHSTTSGRGQDRIPPDDHRGTIIVAGAWLAFYLIMAIHHFIPAAIEIAAQRG